MNNITNFCTGCMACMNICPFNAISMSQNSKGFYEVKIDKKKCTNCGKCKKVCPQINKISLKHLNKECYATKASDEIRKNSSSGGAFTILAKHILNQGGYVCGAAFNNDFKSVSHIIVDNIEDLKKIKSSKYLQSCINDILKSIKTLLDDNKLVLFSGTPCQTAGLKNYLQKDYSNLITIDILCHGTPSPKVWQKYVEKITQNQNVVYANFRDKRYGAKQSLLVLELQDGSVFEENSSKSLFYRTFLENMTLNDCCYKCNYANISRVGDITLGDFWGIEKYNKKLNDNKGISLLLINTPKGLEIFKSIKKDLFNKKIPEKYAIKGNPILKQPFKKHSNRDIFFENIDKKDIFINMEDSLSNKYDGIITNFWWSNNYGAILTAYAIQILLKEIGHNFYLLNFIPGNFAVKKFVKDFANKYLKITHEIKTNEDFKNLNAATENFIVGSDQVFRHLYTKPNTDKYMLAYTDFSKKRIAFSASFGTDKYDEATDEQKYLYKKYLNRFDTISTRELSGVDICKKEFNITAQHLIDPVFIVDRKVWEDFDNKASISNKYKHKIASYILDENDEIKNVYTYICNKYNKELETLAGKDISVQEFVVAIKNAEYFITDSFHGICFALIFHKKVVCLINKDRGSDRFKSLIELFDIKHLFVNNINEIYMKSNLFEDYDIQDFEKIINEHRVKAKNFLEKALQNKEITNDKISNELDFLNNKPNYTEDKKKQISLKYTFIERIFSVKNACYNNRVYKVLTIFGAKIFIKKKEL